MRWPVIPFLLAGLASPALAQIGLPPLGRTVDGIAGTLNEAVDGLTGIDARAPIRSASQLARDRIARLADFVRAYRESVEYDDGGQPARRGVVLLIDADEASLAEARRLGFTVGDVDDLGNLGLSATELTVPEGMDLRKAVATLRKALPGQSITADQLHFPGGSAAASSSGAASLAPPMRPIATRVGLIDGGVAATLANVEARGFARGAPSPGDHGTAVASLLRHAGVSRIVAADVYGGDPAGGNALAIARALNWLAGEGLPVISISLVGPRNPLIERSVAVLARRGVIIVAAVGNDGPSAPPAYPASYPSVIAVTGVDGRNRALIEAGRALHLDYAAPGANMKALDRQGQERMVRGTSFAAPLAAARAAAAMDRGKSGQALRSALDAEARDLGKKGPDKLFGRGLLCGDCRRR